MQNQSLLPNYHFRVILIVVSVHGNTLPVLALKWNKVRIPCQRNLESNRFLLFLWQVSYKFPIVLKTVIFIIFWLALWQLWQINQVTNKLNTELEQKDQTFIIIASLVYAFFASKRMKVDFCLDTNSAG